MRVACVLWLGACAACAAGAACGRLDFADRATGASDGRTTDGPATDGRATDGAGLDSQPDIGCPAGVQLCDGFESATLGAMWTPDPMVTRDTTIAHRGGASMHMHLDEADTDTSARSQLLETETFAGSGSTFWLREWVMLSALPIGQNALELTNADEPQPGTAGDAIFAEKKQTSVYAQFPDNVQDSPNVFPTSTWVCLIWQVVLSDTTGSLDLSGGVPTIHLDSVTDGTPAINQLWLGLRLDRNNVTSDQPALDLWIDDVIVNDAAVACTD